MNTCDMRVNRMQRTLLLSKYVARIPNYVYLPVLKRCLDEFRKCVVNKLIEILVQNVENIETKKNLTLNRHQKFYCCNSKKEFFLSFNF